MFVGFIVGGSAKNNTSMMAAMSLIGFVSVPERIVISDTDYDRVPVMLRWVHYGGTRILTSLIITACGFCSPRTASKQMASRCHRSSR